MSRIEEALKKARELSRAQILVQEATGFKDEVSDAMASRRFHSVAEEVSITSPRLVAVNDCNLPITEEYKKLKSVVIRKIKDGNLSRLILVTSALSGEGKSVTALNLAISLAQDYDRAVTLVDTDFRNPSISRYLGLKRRAGLADCLADDIPLEDVLLETGMGNLTLLAAGRKVENPVELLSSQKMPQVLQRLRELIPGGYVIFDSCPILPFAEPSVIAALVDNTVLVVKEGGTSQKNFHDALECLGHSTLLGVVYNKATTSAAPGGYRYYYNNYARRENGCGTSEKKPGIWAKILRKVKKEKGGEDLNV